MNDRSIYWVLFGNLPLISHVTVFSVVPLLILCGPATPRTRALLSNSVPARYQARIFSAFSAVESIGSIISPIFNLGYAASVRKHYPGCMYTVMAFLGITAATIILWIRSNRNLSDNLPVSDGIEIKDIKMLPEDSIRGNVSSVILPSNSSGNLAAIEMKDDKFQPDVQIAWSCNVIYD